MHKYFVYILFSKRNGTLYIGITNDLVRRNNERKKSLISGFTAKYGVDKLAYAEEFRYVFTAIEREKQMKKWGRKMKIDLIEQYNPEWEDLSNYLI